MKCVINDQLVLLRAPEGPLAAHVASFSNWAMSRDMRCVRCGGEFGSLRVLVGGSQTRRSDCAASLRRIVPGTFDIAPGGCGFARVTATALRQLLDFLRHQGLISAEKVHRPRLSPVERCAQAYERYLREERILAKATIVNYVPFIRGSSRIASATARSGSRAWVRGCRTVCAAPGPAAASEASQAPHHRAALLPAIRALPGRHPVGSGRSRPACGELVDVVDSRGPFRPTKCADSWRNQSAYRGRTSRLCDLAPARTLGSAFRRSGVP